MTIPICNACWPIKEPHFFLCLLQEDWWFLAAGLIALFIILYFKFRRGKSWLLSEKIKQEINAAQKVTFLSRVKILVEQIYYPSAVSVTAVLLTTFIVGLLSRIGLSSTFLDFENSNHFQNLIAIHTGIGSIIFALLIFIAESLRDDETKDRARVLLRESFLFPLTVLEIVGLFIFVWGNVNILSVLMLVLIAIFTIASLWRLLAVLLNKAKFFEKRMQLLRDRIRLSIKAAIEERLGNNYLLKTLRNENEDEENSETIALKFYPFSLDAEESHNRHLITAPKTGTITDVRLDKLKEFSERLEKEANRNGFSFYKGKKKPLISTTQADTATAGISQEYEFCDDQYLHKKFLDSVSGDDSVLISIEKKVVGNKKILQELNALAAQIFEIKRRGTFNQEMKLEIDGLKGQLITAISEKREDKVEELTNSFSALAEVFLEELKRFGGGYSYEQATKERSSLVGGWKEMGWLWESVRTISIHAARSDDPDIFRHTAFLPISIAIKALEFGDHYLFQEFIGFPSLLYGTVEQNDKPEMREAIVDRSWRYLKEVAEFHIGYQLKRKIDDPKEFSSMRGFMIPIFSSFQNLIKTAFKKKDNENFDEFVNQFTLMLEDFDIRHENQSAESMKVDLEFITDPSKKEELKQRIATQEAREEAIEDISRKRNQILFGLSAHILERTLNVDTALKPYFEKVLYGLPTNIPDLMNVYNSSRSFEVQRLWNWDNWEMVPDGRVHEINFTTKLDTLFCVAILRRLEGLPDGQIRDLSLSTTRDLASLVENKGDRGIMNILDGIQNNQEHWKAILSTRAVNKIPVFKELLLKAKEEQEKIENDSLEKAAIDDTKRERFKKEVKESFYSTGTLRPIFEASKAYDSTQINMIADKSVPAWGYKQINEKAPFIEKWHVHYVGLAKTYGEGMARTEDRFVFSEMLKVAPAPISVQPEAILSSLQKALQEKQFNVPILIHTMGYPLANSLFGTPDFIPYYHKDCPSSVYQDTEGFRGILKIDELDVPIIDLFLREDGLEDKIILTSIKDFGSWDQYSPLWKAGKRSDQYDIFFFKISDLNQDEEARNKILTEDPLWLQQQAPDKDGYLKRHVLIDIHEKFKFRLINQNQIVAFDVQKKET